MAKVQYHFVACSGPRFPTVYVPVVRCLCKTAASAWRNETGADDINFDIWILTGPECCALQDTVGVHSQTNAKMGVPEKVLEFIVMGHAY